MSRPEIPAKCFFGSAERRCGATDATVRLPSIGKTVELLAGKRVNFFQVIFTGPKVGVGPTESELGIRKAQYELPFWLAMDEQRLTKEDFPHLTRLPC